MAEYTFTTAAGQTVARELLLAYLNTGTSSAPVWSVIGKRVEDSSEEYDWSAERKKDILGDTYGTMWCVDEGLAEGEQVVTAGQQKLRDGMKVIPVKR